MKRSIGIAGGVAVLVLLLAGAGFVTGRLLNSQALWEVHHNGPVAEVVTTQQTLIYCDDTLRQIEGSPPSGPIQQVLTLSTLDAIGKDSIVSAWVERRDNRLVAKVIVFSSIV